MNCKNMIKWTILLLLQLTLILSPVISVADIVEVTLDDSYYRVFDRIGALTEAQLSEIDARILEFAETHHMDLAFSFTLDLAEEYGDVRISEFLDHLYGESKYGYGPDRAGIIFGSDEALKLYNYNIYGDLPQGLSIETLEMIFDGVTASYPSDELYPAILHTIDLLDAALVEREAMLFDFADLLTDEEEAKIKQRMVEFRNKYQMNLIYYFAPHASYEGEWHRFLKDLFDYLNFGYGDTIDGVIFGLDMEGRDYSTVVTGKAEEQIHFSLIKEREGVFVDLLKSGDYYEAIQKHLNVMESIASGDYKREEAGKKMLWGTLISAVVALLITAGAAYSQKIVTPKISAMEYIVPGTVRVTEDRDVFTHTTKTKTKRSSGGGGSSGSSGTSTGSSGSSYGHSSGKF